MDQKALKSFDGHASRVQSVALQALGALAAGETHPETLHRLRTHLRRLQAYLELVGESGNAALLAECVSHFSPLRTLQVFEQFLVREGAPPSDVDLVRAEEAKCRRKLSSRRTYRQVERIVRRHALAPLPGRPDWLSSRLDAIRAANLEALLRLARKAEAKPSRKRLHRLRLTIKSIRYQEEWAGHESPGQSKHVAYLKKAQTVLGRYEELGQFRKLGKKLGLASLALITRAFKKARKRARALVPDLAGFLDPGQASLHPVPPTRAAASDPSTKTM